MPRLAAADETSPLLDPSVSPWLSTHNGSEQPKLPSRSRAQTSLAFRIAAAMYSFFVLGLFTASIGVMLQPMLHYYALTDLSVSLIFLVGPIGYVLAAQCNDTIHSRFGQRGIAFLGPVFHVLSGVAISMHPPFWMILVSFALVNIGAGLIDGSLCAWAGSMSKANMVSGFLHGSFSVGAAAGPFFASILLDAEHRPWYEWYRVLVVASIVESAMFLFAFRHEDASRYRQEKRADLVDGNVDPRTIFKHRATWLSAAYFLGYVGTETAISGWIISFMKRARRAPPTLASLSSSGFWAGMAVGRLSLGTLTDRIGVRRATAFYFLCAMLLQALFVILRQPVLDIVIMTFMGFFMGALFPSGIVALAQVLPKELHIGAVSFVASLGQVGGALLPFGIGAVVQGLGIGVFQYAILLETGLSLALWIIFARLHPAIVVATHEGLEDESEARVRTGSHDQEQD